MHYKRIKELREENELTQEQVVQILGCQRKVYRRYEAGEREIPISYAVKLAQHYQVSVDYLVGLTDMKKSW